jgi:hypothetical protein
MLQEAIMNVLRMMNVVILSAMAIAFANIAYATDYSDNKSDSKAIKLSPESLERMEEVIRRTDILSIEAANIMEKNCGLRTTSPETSVTRFISSSRGVEIIRGLDDLIWIGCYENPPGVCCAGPCPCQ